MQRRALLLHFAALPALLAAPAALAQPALQPPPQDAADIARVEAYLNGIRTLQAHFLQVAPDGQLSQGTAWLERPGHLRFQYDPPNPYLLVTGYGQLIFEDRSIKQVSEIPLSRTPLGILLADHVSLSGGITVTGIRRLPGQIQLTVVRTASPGDGSLTLVFSENPLALRQWTVVDAQRRATHVTLYNVETGVSLNPKLFEFVDPQQGGVGGGG
ncbi:MAG TPA: outer membrane lipoprotein carrier protein LolA [Acetobacteraceae bacterium]|jgi:outer membrane lipoprotein-sorting protein